LFKDYIYLIAKNKYRAAEFYPFEESVKKKAAESAPQHEKPKEVNSLMREFLTKTS
jgi:hypothetical protein